MRIVYVLPGYFAAGGVRLVVEHVAGLAARGHPAEVWFPRSDAPRPRFGRPAAVLREFPDAAALFRELAAVRGVKVATWWATAAPVAAALGPGDRGFYFVQDIETSFVADPAEADRVLASYRLGLTPITEGHWVHAQLRDRFGLAPRYVGIGLSHDAFFPDPAATRGRTVVAQARVWGGGPNQLKDWPTTAAVLARVAAAGSGTAAVTYAPLPVPTLPGVAHNHLTSPTDADMAGLFRTAGAFLFASRHEGFGLPPAEAMACGCPVVSTRANGNEEFCIDGETALMAAPGDVDGLADRVRRVLDDPALAARMADAGRERVQEYRWDRVIDRLVEALELPAATTRRAGGVSPPSGPAGAASGREPLAEPTRLTEPSSSGRRVALLVSELGGGFGHVVPLLRLAGALAASGFAPAFAVRNVREVWPVLRDAGYPLVQAPVHHPAASEGVAGLLAGYVDVLALNGFRSADSLLPLVTAWDHLLAAVRPALVIADHSPVAVLAANGAVPVVQVGAGFEVPPLDRPTIPALLKDGVRVLGEADVLAVVNAMQVARGRNLSATLTEALRTPRAVAAWPELDPYRPVRADRCVGPLAPIPDVVLPPADSRGVFAYLNATGVTDEGLVALVGGGAGTVYLRGADPARIDRLRAAGVAVATGLRPWVDVLRDAAVVVHHGGIGTTQATLAAGRPQVLIPEHLEHLLTAHLLDGLGVGVKVLPPATAAGLRAAVERAGSADVAARCRAFAEGLRGRPDRDGLDAVAELCRQTVG